MSLDEGQSKLFANLMASTINPTVYFKITAMQNTGLAYADGFSKMGFTASGNYHTLSLNSHRHRTLLMFYELHLVVTKALVDPYELFLLGESFVMGDDFICINNNLVSSYDKYCDSVCGTITVADNCDLVYRDEPGGGFLRRKPFLHDNELKSMRTTERLLAKLLVKKYVKDGVIEFGAATIAAAFNCGHNKRAYNHLRRIFDLILLENKIELSVFKSMIERAWYEDTKFSQTIHLDESALFPTFNDVVSLHTLGLRDVTRLFSDVATYEQFKMSAKIAANTKS
jgi:hypothetical protein